MACDLRDDVRRCAKAVNAEPPRIADFSQTSIADQPRAEQRRGCNIIVSVGNSKAETRVRDCVFRIAAVDCVTGEARPLAQVLAPA